MVCRCTLNDGARMNVGERMRRGHRQGLVMLSSLLAIGIVAVVIGTSASRPTTTDGRAAVAVSAGVTVTVPPAGTAKLDVTDGRGPPMTSPVFLMVLIPLPTSATGSSRTVGRRRHLPTRRRR